MVAVWRRGDVLAVLAIVGLAMVAGVGVPASAASTISITSTTNGEGIRVHLISTSSDPVEASVVTNGRERGRVVIEGDAAVSIERGEVRPLSSAETAAAQARLRALQAELSAAITRYVELLRAQPR